MKKILVGVLAVFLLIGITGCGKEKNIEGSLEDIMTKVYADIPEDERPMMLQNTEVTKENIEQYLGTSDIEFKEALVSESPITSVAHSVVLLRLDEKTNVEEVKKKIDENADPRKWICVGAEEKKVLSKGNLVLLIMTSTSEAEKLENSFNNLK